ncbi:hypothetical protein EB008_02675 [bacterium]|nr:hypothetical protein [bacterium]
MILLFSNPRLLKFGVKLFQTKPFFKKCRSSHERTDYFSIKRDAQFIESLLSRSVIAENAHRFLRLTNPKNTKIKLKRLNTKK